MLNVRELEDKRRQRSASTQKTRLASRSSNNYHAHYFHNLWFLPASFAQNSNPDPDERLGERKFGNNVSLANVNENIILLTQFVHLWIIFNSDSSFFILLFGETCMKKQHFADEWESERERERGMEEWRRAGDEKCRTSWKMLSLKSWSSNHPQFLFPVVLPCSSKFLQRFWFLHGLARLKRSIYLIWIISCIAAKQSTSIGLFGAYEAEEYH